MNTYLDVLQRYADFSGRSTRKEYWTFYGINLAIAVAMLMVFFSSASSIAVYGVFSLMYVFGVITFVAGTSLITRRLHDTGRSGWWQLLYLAPFVGVVVVTAFCLLESEPGENRYGPNPLESED